MKKIIFNTVLFTVGAAIGSAVTWNVVKNKYERLIHDEIEAFKVDYARCMSCTCDEETHEDEYSEDDDEEDECVDDEDPNMTTYRDIANEYGESGDYTENDEEGAGDEDIPYINGPYVIPPEDFGDGNFDHDLISITYYADGVLADDWYMELDIEETVGEDSLKHIGDHADGVIHVRNERLNADYEVVSDPRNYADLIANDPLMQAYAK